MGQRNRLRIERIKQGKEQSIRDKNKGKEVKQ